jgi:hypothetical protein
MKSMRRILFLRPAAALVAVGMLTARAGIVQNPSFESNYNDAFPHYGAIDLWSGGSGVNEAGGPFHNGGTPIPDNFRAAFSQGSATLSQELTGLQPGKRYWLQFFYDARGCCGGSIDISVKFNDVELDKIPNVRPATGGNPYHFRSVAFTPESDVGTLALVTTAAGDATVNWDAVSVVQRDEGQVVMMNPSFEASGDPADPGYISPEPLAGWTGTGQYGVNLSGVGPFANNGTAPEQDHVAFLQGVASLSQSVPNLAVGTTYQLTIAYNARGGNTPHIQVKAGEAVLFEEDVNPVGGAAAYRTKSVTFAATDLAMPITIAQTKDGDQTLLIDDIKISGQIIEPLPPLTFAPTGVEIAPSQRQVVTVTVPTRLTANKDATLKFGSSNQNIARLVNADEEGNVTLTFAKGGATSQTLEFEAVARGSARLTVIEAAGLTVADDVALNVVSSFVRNSSFESSAVPGGVGYGAILAWNGGSGLNKSTGPFHDNGLIPDRQQVAFLQGATTLSQEIVGLTPGESYWLQYFFNARAAGGTTINVTVKFGGTSIDSIVGISAVGEGNPYAFRNVLFTPTSANGLLEFSTVPSGDATLLLDAISIVRRTASEVVIMNPSFEGTGSPTGVGYIAPSPIAGWEQGPGGKGINVNGVGPFSDNGLSTDQDRILFLQGAGSSVSQKLLNLATGQKYTLVYEVNTRNCCTAETPSSYKVTFEGEVLLEEEITIAGGGEPYHVRSVAFTPAATEGAIGFEHTSAGDHSLLLDNVRVFFGDPPVETPKATLAVTRAANGSIRVSWPTSATGWTLQETAALPAGWANSTATVTTEGTENVASLPADGAGRFLRLTK